MNTKFSLFILSSAVFLISACNPGTNFQIQERYASALLTVSSDNCVEPNENEQRAFELAASVIEFNSIEPIVGHMDTGANKVLANGIYRRTDERTFKVCTPQEILLRVAEVFIERKTLGRGRLVEYNLALAEQLPIRSKDIIKNVGDSAFNSLIQQSEQYSRKDIRPYARTVLASFGLDAKEYGDIAYSQIDINTPMGTGAAQVAAAAQHSNALPLIEKLMMNEISAISLDEPIPWNTKNRLYELAWAIIFAGDEGQEYSAPIHEIMKYKVQSWAPPYGMLELRPKRFCYVLVRIESEEAISDYDFCRDNEVPMDQ